jgi:type IV pilus assembly protein PilY1
MKKYSLLIITLLIFGVSTQLRADDTDIYQTSSISIPPNVLIIFDTSLSMDTADIPGGGYDPATTYSGSYTTNGIYTKSCNYWGCSYNRIVWNYNDINCSDAKTDLESQGYSSQGISYNYYSHSWGCNDNGSSLYLGNWLNYDQAPGGGMKTRMEVAKEVVTNIINQTENVRFGLMRFNYEDGGYIVAPVGTDKQTLTDAIAGFTPHDFTPLAETLAEAGLYFAGQHSWFNGTSGTYSSDCHDNGNNCKQYTSPIQYRCQKNYVILMTDGEPTQDRDAKLSSPSYINGDTIGDYDGDGNDPGPDDGFWHPSDYLDDVAKYLYENDLSDLGTAGESFEKQNIILYTIGFLTEQDLLSEAANNGGGHYYTANSVSGLSAAFEDIISNIADVNAVFVSPVVPVSRMNRTYAGNSLYVGFFKPQANGNWAGNIKKYGLNNVGDIVDANGNEATLADGTIKDNARSYWSPLADGSDVLSGGVGGLLLNQATRNLYTYMGTSLNLSDSTNAFTTSNTAITETTLDVSSSTEKDDVINFMYGEGRDWVMGDILHSKPSVVHYDTDGNGSLDEAFIFTGSNDGLMHCFKDSDGSEVWGFIPPDLLPFLKGLSDASDTEHKYFMDGVPEVYEGSNQKILFFGERRGGYNYYALNVTTYDSPSLAYTIDQTFLETEDGDQNGANDGEGAKLGQSWSSPTVHKIKTSSGSDPETVFLMAGGYDDNQDKALPADPSNPQADERAANDNEGRAVFTIDALTGAISALNVNAGYYNQMTHSIVDVAGFDSNGNGITNRVYAGDLGGNIFAFKDDGTDETGGPIEAGGDGVWSQRKLFSASAVDGVQRKIFYSPDAVEESYGELIFFGTGDRADPEGTGVVNRIYAVKNNWESVGFTTLTESDLYDATENLIVLGTDGDGGTKQAAKEALSIHNGWFIKLDQNTGEKMTSPVVVFNGVVYFTTYTPESGSPPPDDPCETVSGRGTARLYALNYKTGEAAFEWSDAEETDAAGNTVDKGRHDRSKIIGTSIASAPVVAILEGGPKIYIGVEGGVKKEDPNVTKAMETFYWRQMEN